MGRKPILLFVKVCSKHRGYQGYLEVCTLETISTTEKSVWQLDCYILGSIAQTVVYILPIDAANSPQQNFVIPQVVL